MNRRMPYVMMIYKFNKFYVKMLSILIQKHVSLFSSNICMICIDWNSCRLECLNIIYIFSGLPLKSFLACFDIVFILLINHKSTLFTLHFEIVFWSATSTSKTCNHHLHLYICDHLSPLTYTRATLTVFFYIFEDIEKAKKKLSPA
jgi:hypothetical protein